MNPCLHCGSARLHPVISLGNQPLANSYLSEAQLAEVEPRYPLDLYVCEDCLLTQIEVAATSEHIFSDYAYFSSFSSSWLEHARRYVEGIIPRLELAEYSRVVEIASNDGYLLQYFIERGVPCLGIEPAVNIARFAQDKGVPTEIAFWSSETAQHLLERDGPADLILGNNVLAHVPTLNDFVAGVRIHLRPGGVATFEFPHLLRLVEECQFDTIYHEHFSYFAFFVVCRIFEHHGLFVFDVEELPTHGGSLRVYACHRGDETKPRTAGAVELLAREEAAGMHNLAYYDAFAQRVEAVRAGVLAFLHSARAEGKLVAGYGAPAKGNTLLNYCGVTPELMAYTVDLSPHKQGHYLPGSHLPIRNREVYRVDKPAYVFILPWNLREEIMGQMAHVAEWGGKFVTPIPEVRVW